MNILHAVEAPLWTGAVGQTFETVIGLTDRGHRVTLATTPGSIIAERAKAAGLDVVAMELRRELDPFAIAKLSDVICGRGVELVHAHRAHAHTIALAASWLTRRPFIVSRHTALRPKDNFGSRLKYRSRVVTRTVAISRAVREVLVDYGVPDDRIAVIHDGIDPERFAGGDGTRIRSELGIPADALLVGKIANAYGESKGHDTFLAAAARLRMELPGARFLLVGKGTDSERMRAAVEALGLGDAVELAGYRSDVPDVLAGLDVLVNCPKSREGLSVAVMEAFSAARPVVATAVGGIPELVADGATGLLVPPGDANALANAVARLLRDPDLAGRLAGAGAAFVRENLTVDVMVEKTEALYREILRR
jgi:glycosyltransferase involved in cell wall biosynthesis